MELSITNDEHTYLFSCDIDIPSRVIQAERVPDPNDGDARVSCLSIQQALD